MFTLSQELLNCHALPVRSCKKTWDFGQEGQPDLAKRAFYSIEHHAWYINWGGLAQIISCSGKAGDLLVGDEQKYCASLVCLRFYASLSFSCNNNKTILISNY